LPGCSGGWRGRLSLPCIITRASSESLAGDERDQRDQRDRGNSPRQRRREAPFVAGPVRLAGGRPAPVAEPRAGRELRSARRARDADERRAARGAESPVRRGAARRTGLRGRRYRRRL